ncbi:PIN domain-containing protein [Catalinimonas sp. 4WD22]|uniref:PIN domain-containing protein n=1 Tax=Catalinimonas locisalis TaxID=3133978 RepID=UPI0031018D1C
MSGNSLFVDTNILLYFLDGDSDVIEMIADKNIIISFISEPELLAFPKISAVSEETIKGLLKNCTIVDISPEIKDLTIEFRRKSKLKFLMQLLLLRHCTSNYHYLLLTNSSAQ